MGRVDHQLCFKLSSTNLGFNLNWFTELRLEEDLERTQPETKWTGRKCRKLICFVVADLCIFISRLMYLLPK